MLRKTDQRSFAAPTAPRGRTGNIESALERLGRAVVNFLYMGLFCRFAKKISRIDLICGPILWFCVKSASPARIAVLDPGGNQSGRRGPTFRVRQLARRGP